MKATPNNSLFHQFYTELARRFEPQGGIVAAYHIGTRIDRPELFEEEKRRLLQGEFQSAINIHFDLYTVWGLVLGNGNCFVVFVSDPEDLWYFECILCIDPIDAAVLDRMWKEVFFDLAKGIGKPPPIEPENIWERLRLWWQQ